MLGSFRVANICSYLHSRGYTAGWQGLGVRGGGRDLKDGQDVGVAQKPLLWVAGLAMDGENSRVVTLSL